MKKLAILLFAAGVAFGAEDQSVRVFQLKYAEPHRLRTVLGPLAHDIQFDPQLKVLTIRPRLDAMPEIERLIQRLDVPPPPVENIDVTIYLMSALAQPAASATPAELETVVKQLKSMFSYKGYQL